MAKDRRPPGFDGAAAVTRSLLGYGVVAGAFYLVVGFSLAVARDGFELTRHPLSLLMLGEHGWMQRANLVLTGVMVIAAAVGFARALRGSKLATRAGALLGVDGVALIASGIFPPDPMAGFPPGTTDDVASVAGVLHLAFGAIGFVCLAVVAFVVAAWFAQRGEAGWTRYSRISGAVIILGFVAGAALATRPAGVAALWVAVVVGWVWLAASSVRVYRTVPHPDPDRRTARMS